MVGSRTGFTICVVASLLMHVVVLAGMGAGCFVRSAPIPIQQRIDVRLVRVEQPGADRPPPDTRTAVPPPRATPSVRFAGPDRPRSDMVPPPQPRPVPIPDAPPLLEPDLRRDRPPRQDALVPPVPTWFADGDEDATRAYWDRVRAQIMGQLRYPPSARNRRREGRVLVSLTLDAAGRLRGLSHRSDTADPELRRAVLTAVERGAPYPAPPARVLAGGSVTGELSIRFEMSR